MSSIEQAQGEAAEEVATSILCAIASALKRHGPDPDSDAVVGAGIIMAIEALDEKVYRGFAQILVRRLAKSETKR